MFKYYQLHPYNQTSRLIDKSEQKKVNNMKNRNHHNNKQRQDKRPFAHSLKRALLYREGENLGTAQHISTIPAYQITIEHGSIRIRQERVASALPA
ncbi:MAG: hypothetical protein IMY74_05660 [Bacteroidetes bacterium]|nr:hypothetical protein [Bacteroidota bacterium]